jgi:tetratricopeptide (TPR) repeat protein
MVFLSFFALLIAPRAFPNSEMITAHISRGDAAYDNFDNQTALANYQKALELDSLNYEAAWKLCRAYVDVGEQTADKNTRQNLYEEAVKYGRKAVGSDSGGAYGHLFLSVALGRKALDSGVKERVRLAKEIRREIETSLALDSTIHISWHMLGRWHQKVATLSWIEKKFANLFLGGVPKDASLETAVKCFQKAITLFPEGSNHHLQLGITYEEMGKKDLAIAEYQRVLLLPKTEADDEIHKAEARKRLKKLK